MQVGKIVSEKTSVVDREKHLKKLHKTVEVLKKHITKEINLNDILFIDNIYLKVAPYLQTGDKKILEVLELIKQMYDRIYEKQQSAIYDELLDAAEKIARDIRPFSPQRRLFFDSLACKVINSITIWYGVCQKTVVLQVGNYKFEVHKYNKDYVANEVKKLVALIHKRLYEFAETVPDTPENFKIPIEVSKLLTVRITDDFRVQLIDYAYISGVRDFYDFVEISKDGKVIKTPKSNLRPDNIRSFAEVLEKASNNYKILPLHSSFDYWVYNDRFDFWRCRIYKHGCKIYRTKHDPYKAQKIQNINEEYILCKVIKVTDKSVWIQPIKDIVKEFENFFGVKVI